MRCSTWEVVSCRGDQPPVTWGIIPELFIGRRRSFRRSQRIADPRQRRAAIEPRRSNYMGLKLAQRRLIGTTRSMWVCFSGRGTHSRLSDLRRPQAEVARGRKVAPGVLAWVGPGSEIGQAGCSPPKGWTAFQSSTHGFECGKPGWLMCLAANG